MRLPDPPPGAPARRGHSTGAVVVRGALALYRSPAEPPLANGWVLIADGTVQATGTGTPPDAASTIDATGCLVLPGMVCAHHHLFQGASRGIPTGGGLNGWLLSHYPHWARISTADVRAAAALSIAQLLVRGCTTVAAFEFLHPAGEDFVTPVVKVAEHLGIRLLYVRGTTPALEPGIEDELINRGVNPSRLIEPRDLALDRIRTTVSARANHHLRWACGPTTPVLDDGGEFQHALNELAREAGVAQHLHFHPLIPPGMAVTSAYQFASDLGLVQEGNWFAHGSRLALADVERLGAAGVGVVHCPSASMILGYPLPSLTAWRHVNHLLAIGVDGAASNDRGSLLGEAQLAFYTQGQPEITSRSARPSPEECLDLVTTSAARTIGWDGAGELTHGSLGDIAVFDLQDLDSAGGPADPDLAVARLFRTHQGARARHVLIGGEPVVTDSHLTTADEFAIAKAANQSAERLGPPPAARAAPWSTTKKEVPA